MLMSASQVGLFGSVARGAETGLLVSSGLDRLFGQDKIVKAATSAPSFFGLAAPMQAVPDGYVELIIPLIPCGRITR
jgi:hypothetical protein